MTTPKKPTKKEAKKFIQSKAYFTSPFSAQWSSLPQEDMHFILNTVKDKLISTGIQKKEDRVFRQWRKKKDDTSSETKKIVVETEDGKNAVKNGWTDVSVRRQLAIGINEATKALERNELQLLLVCKSVKPKHMTEHLITLSVSRGVPACQVPRLSLTVAEPLGLKSVLALGFRRCPEGHQQLFMDVINAITPRVPALEVAWLQRASATENPQESSDMEEDGEKKGVKRKLESKAEELRSLQPLKVKRIVANPAKKRNKKPKKVK